MRCPSTDIICDVADCCETHSELGTVGDVLASARREGWSYRIRSGQIFDVCPEHAKLALVLVLVRRSGMLMLGVSS